MEEIKETLNTEEYSSDFQDPHNASSLMKLWLGSLPTPVIPLDIA